MLHQVRLAENLDNYPRSRGKNKRTRIYQCLEKECGHQFSPTAGTVFHDSHLPLTKWFMAMALICEAKKGISAKQVARHLGLEKSYKTAWYLCHRIRKAMKEGGLLGTGGEVMEADETYLKPRKPRKGAPYVKKEHKEVVLGMVERGGKLRLVPVSGTKVEDLPARPRKAHQPRCEDDLHGRSTRYTTSRCAGIIRESMEPSITAAPTLLAKSTPIPSRTRSRC